MMHRSLASIIDETVSEPREPSHTANSNDLTARLALLAGITLSPFVAFNQQFQESHGSGKHGRDIRIQSLGPDFVRPVVEVVVADFCGGRFGSWFGPCIGRGVEGRLAGVVDEQVNEACFAGDLVDGALEVGVRGCAALNWDEVAVFLRGMSLVGRMEGCGFAVLCCLSFEAYILRFWRPPVVSLRCGR
jgi:hypothetical protein